VRAEPLNTRTAGIDANTSITYVHVATSNTNSTLCMKSGQRCMQFEYQIVPAELLPLMA